MSNDHPNNLVIHHNSIDPPGVRCGDCGHTHEGPRFGGICIGCPCPSITHEPAVAVDGESGTPEAGLQDFEVSRLETQAENLRNERDALKAKLAKAEKALATINGIGHPLFTLRTDHDGTRRCDCDRCRTIDPSRGDPTKVLVLVSPAARAKALAAKRALEAEQPAQKCRHGYLPSLCLADASCDGPKIKPDEVRACLSCKKATPHRFHPSPEAGGFWRCSECGGPYEPEGPPAAPPAPKDDGHHAEVSAQAKALAALEAFRESITFGEDWNAAWVRSPDPKWKAVAAWDLKRLMDEALAALRQTNTTTQREVRP